MLNPEFLFVSSIYIENSFSGLAQIEPGSLDFPRGGDGINYGVEAVIINNFHRTEPPTIS